MILLTKLRPYRLFCNKKTAVAPKKDTAAVFFADTDDYWMPSLAFT